MTDGLSVLSDAPSNQGADRLGFGRYVTALVEVIMNEATQTPFTVGVFGAWGSGKSSLLEMIDQKLAADHAKRVVRVRFNPWIYRREPSMLLPLLFTLQDTLQEDRGQRFTEVAGRIGGLLVKLSAGVLLGRMSSGGVTLDSIDKVAREYTAQRRQVDNETRSLRRTLQEQADAIAGKGARLVFLIDDLDRCQPAEIIDLLESLCSNIRPGTSGACCKEPGRSSSRPRRIARSQAPSSRMRSVRAGGASAGTRPSAPSSEFCSTRE